MAKFEVRAGVQMTMDFEVTAQTEGEAEIKVKEYLRHVPGGKLDGQRISLETDGDDKLTHCFVMDCECDDVNEID
jgi:hypothetical protein